MRWDVSVFTITMEERWAAEQSLALSGGDEIGAGFDFVSKLCDCQYRFETVDAALEAVANLRRTMGDEVMRIELCRILPEDGD